MQNQPGWLQDDAENGERSGPSDDGAATVPGPAAAGQLHDRAASNGAANFIGLDSASAAETPYANGDGPHHPAPPSHGAAPAPGAPTATRNPMDDLLSLSGAAPEALREAQPPPPGGLEQPSKSARMCSDALL